MVEIRVTAAREASEIALTARNFLLGTADKEAEDKITLSAVGGAIPVAIRAVGGLEYIERVGTVTGTETYMVDLEGTQCPQLKIDVTRVHVPGERPTPEYLLEECNAKKLAKVLKEGGKRGVEIEGAADMGGLQFFCTAVELPGSDIDLLYESMRGMNLKCDPSEEERKGGSGAIGKLLCSATSEEAVTVMTYVPYNKLSQIRAGDWLKAVVAEVAPGVKLLKSSATHATVVLPQDKEKGTFSIKTKDAVIQSGINFLKGKGLFPDGDSDSEEMIFGDDDLGNI